MSSNFSIRVYTATGSSADVKATMDVIGFCSPILANYTKASLIASYSMKLFLLLTAAS